MVALEVGNSLVEEPIKYLYCIAREAYRLRIQFPDLKWRKHLPLRI
jgi:hypothetical protein